MVQTVSKKDSYSFYNFCLIYWHSIAINCIANHVHQCLDKVDIIAGCLIVHTGCFGPLDGANLSLESLH